MSISNLLFAACAAVAYSACATKNYGRQGEFKDF